MTGRIDGRPEAVAGGVPSPESAFGFNGQCEPDTATAPSSNLGSVKGLLAGVVKFRSAMSRDSIGE